MFSFRRRHNVSFHRPNDGFRLDTDDVEEGVSFWRKLFLGRGRHRSVFSRYIVAGGARDARQEGADAAEMRSWRRFSWVFFAFVLLWLAGYFL